ncbi:MAG: zinc ribbon domain-containing protein [Candidatus Fimenecus sp.]
MKNKNAYIAISIIGILNSVLVPMYDIWGGLFPEDPYISFFDIVEVVFTDSDAFSYWPVIVTVPAFIGSMALFIAAISNSRVFCNVFSILNFLIYLYIYIRLFARFGAEDIFDFDTCSVSVGTWIAFILFIISLFFMDFSQPSYPGGGAVTGNVPEGYNKPVNKAPAVESEVPHIEKAPVFSSAVPASPVPASIQYTNTQNNRIGYMPSAVPMASLNRQNNNGFFMKDYPRLRIALCVYVVAAELFKFAWTYLLSPISELYVSGLKQDVLSVISLVLLAVYIGFFIRLSLIPLNKSWKQYVILFGVILFFSEFLSIFSSYISGKRMYEAGMNEDFSSHFFEYLMIQIAIIAILLFFNFAVFSGKKAFKYTFIVLYVILVGLSLYSVISDIVFSFSQYYGQHFVYGVMLEDWQRPYAYITYAIRVIPTFTVAALILGFLMKTEKKTKVLSYSNESAKLPNGQANPISNSSVYKEPNVFTPAPSNTNQRIIKYCPQCGKEVESKAVFCGKCGHKLK